MSVVARGRAAPVVKRHSGVPLRSLLVPAAAAVAVVVAGYPDRVAMLPLVTGLAVAAFLLTLNNSAWALVPLMLVELTASEYMNPQIHVSARLGTCLLAVLLSAPLIVRAAQRQDPYLKRLLAPAVILLAVATLRNLTSSNISYSMQYARYQVTLIGELVVAATVIRSRDGAQKVAWCALVLGMANGVAALWQHYWPSKALYIDASVQTVGSWDGRAIGLSTSPVTLGATLLFVLVPVLGFLVTGPARFERKQVLLGLAAFAMFAGLYFTYTRSAMIGLGGGLFVIGLQLSGRRRRLVLGGVVAAVLLYELLSTIGLVGSRYSSTSDDSAATHQVLQVADLQIALSNPLIGIGSANFLQVSAQYGSQVAGNISSQDAVGLAGLGNEQAHDDFLYVWLSWGIVAFVCFLLVFVGAMKNFRVAAVADDTWTARFAVSCSGGLMAYAVNSAFHNYLDSSTLLWLYAGVSIALARLPADIRVILPSSLSRRRQRIAVRRRRRPTTV